MTTDNMIHIGTFAMTLAAGGVAWLIKEVRSLRIEQVKSTAKLDYLTTNGVVAAQKALEQEVSGLKERLASLESRLAGQ